MTRRVAAILSAGLGVVVSMMPVQARAVQAADAPSAASATAAQRIIVTLANDARRRADDFLHDMQALHGLRGSPPFALKSIGATCLVLQIPEGTDAAAVLARLSSDPRLSAVQKVHTFRTRAEEEPQQDQEEEAPKPPLPAANAPGREGTDRYQHLQKGYELVRAEAAHRWATGKGVRVALVDTPVVANHPDLKGQVVKERLFVHPSSDPWATRHATAMAGVIAARRNGVGIVGVAPAARLISLGACRLEKTGSAAALCDTDTLARALDSAIKDRADVIVLSLGGPEDPLLARLVTAAIVSGSVVVVASNWRDRANAGFPSLPGVLPAQEPAPGGAVVHPWDPEAAPLGGPNNGILTSVPPSIWDYLRGDSMSAAHVAGVVALIRERAPKMSASEIGLLLRSTAQPRIGLSPEMGTGIIDACSALAHLAGTTCAQ